MSRGPRPADKPSDRPTVPEVAEVLGSYYALPFRGAGGSVHAILEDGNVDQCTADHCARAAYHWARPPDLAEHRQWDILVARLLAAMTSTQRRRLASMSHYQT